jgi:hypothetical protein
MKEEIFKILFSIINNKKIDLAQYEKKENANKFYIDKENANIIQLQYLADLLEIDYKKDQLTKDKLKQQNKQFKEHIDKFEIISLMFGVSDFNNWLKFNTKEDLIQKLKRLNRIRHKCYIPIDLRPNTLKVSKGVSNFLNDQIKQGKIKNMK